MVRITRVLGGIVALTASSSFRVSATTLDSATNTDSGENDEGEYQIGSLRDVDGFGVLPGGVGSHALGYGGSSRPPSSSGASSHFGSEGDSGSTSTPPTSISEGSDGSYDSDDSELVYNEDDDVILDPSMLTNHGPPYLPPDSESEVGTPESSDTELWHGGSSEANHAESRPVINGRPGKTKAFKKPKVPLPVVPHIRPDHPRSSSGSSTSSSTSETASQIPSIQIVGGTPTTLSTSVAKSFYKATHALPASVTSSVGQNSSFYKASHASPTFVTSSPMGQNSSFYKASHASLATVTSSSVEQNSSVYKALHASLASVSVTSSSVEQNSSFYKASRPSPTSSKARDTRATRSAEKGPVWPVTKSFPPFMIPTIVLPDVPQ